MKDDFSTEKEANNGEEKAAESGALYAAPEEPIAAGEVPAKSYFEKFLDQRFALVETKINSLKELFQHVLAQIDKRFAQVDKRFEQIDKRFEEINWRFEQVNRRFGDVDKRLDNLVEKIDRLSEKIDGLYKWVIGLIAGTFLTYLASAIFR